MDERLLALIPLTMLLGLIGYMTKSITRQGCAEHCQRLFGFYPEGNLTREDRRKIFNVIVSLRAEYDKACSLELKHFNPYATGSARLTFENDIEFAAQKLSEAYGVARKVCKQYGQRHYRQDLLRKLTELAYPEQVWGNRGG